MVAVDGDLDPDEGVGSLADGGGDEALGDGVGEAVGMAGGNVFGVVGQKDGSLMVSCTQRPRSVS